MAYIFSATRRHVVSDNNHPTALQRVLRMASLHRQRRDLSKLSDNQLHDVGLDRDTAMKEARRPIWDAPENWRF